MFFVPVFFNQCENFIGVVFEDGLPPYFLRYTINSVALEFVPTALFENPMIKREEEKKAKIKKIEDTKHNLMEKDPYHPNFYKPKTKKE